MMKKTTTARVNKFLATFVLIILHAAPNWAQPIQNVPDEVLQPSAVSDDSASGDITAEVPAEATPAEYLAASPQWFGDDEWAAEQEHVRPVRNIGFGGIGGGFVGGFAGGAVAPPVYSVPLVQTVPVITTVPVVSTITTYPNYAGYGYGGYAPVGFGGVGFGKFRSSFSAKGFGLGGGFIG